jgi:hypothetical protein
VIFEAVPAQRAEGEAKLFVKQQAAAYLRRMVEEIRLELRDPTQQLRDIVNCVGSEEKVREFLRLFADAVEELMPKER